MNWNRYATPSLLVIALACQAPGDAGDSVQPGAEEELGSAVGLEGVAAFRGFDSNVDARLDEAEFIRWATSPEWLGYWDSDASGAVSVEEFDRSAFRAWDRDNDGTVDQQEFERAAEVWLPNAQLGSFADWDGDGDGSIGPQDFNRELHEHNLYDTFGPAPRGVLEPVEFGRMWFPIFDLDNDGFVTEPELQLAGDLGVVRRP